MVILFGRGILGSVVYDYFSKMGAKIRLVTRDTLDFITASPSDIFQFLKACRPESCVINAAAFTDVNGAEGSHAPCFRINAFAPEAISNACRDMGHRFIHISSNFVFDGDKATPYCETDSPRPVNLYGLSKWVGEKFIVENNPEATIIRTGYLYNSRKGFIPGLLKVMSQIDTIKAVADQYIAPTCTVDLAKQLWLLCQNSELPGGVYHANCTGVVTPYAVAAKIAERYGLKINIEKIDAATFYKGVAVRPTMGALENVRLHAAGLDIMPNWEDAFASTEFEE